MDKLEHNGIATSPGDSQQPELAKVDNATVAYYCDRKIFYRALTSDADSMVAQEIEMMAKELLFRRSLDLDEEEIQALRFFLGPVLRDPSFHSKDLSDMWHDVRRRAQDVLQAIINDSKKK